MFLYHSMKDPLSKADIGATWALLPKRSGHFISTDSSVHMSMTFAISKPSLMDKKYHPFSALLFENGERSCTSLFIYSSITSLSKIILIKMIWRIAPKGWKYTKQKREGRRQVGVRRHAHMLLHGKKTRTTGEQRSLQHLNDVDDDDPQWKYLSSMRVLAVRGGVDDSCIVLILICILMWKQQSCDGNVIVMLQVLQSAPESKVLK